jgi:hypothetical protein
MKLSLFYTITFALAILVPMGVYSQLLPGGKFEDNEKKIKVKDPDAPKFAVSLGTKASQMRNDFGYELGFELGVYFNRNIKLTIDSYSLLSTDVYVIDNSKYAHLRLTYVNISPTFYLDLINGIYPFLSVSGGLAYASYGINKGIDLPANLTGEWFLLGETFAGVEFPVSSSISLALSAGWRLASGPEIGNFRGSDLSNLVYKLNMILVTF